MEATCDTSMDFNNNDLEKDDTLSGQSDENGNFLDMAELQAQLLSLNPDQMIRGSTPTGIEQRCLELCRAYIGGSWFRAGGVEDILVKRIGGGFTNQLYHVRLLLEGVDDDGPSEVAIKFYQAKHMKNYHKDDSERLNDHIILTIASQMGIGPKVYGIFEDGFIQAYVKVSVKCLSLFVIPKTASL